MYRPIKRETNSAFGERKRKRMKHEDEEEDYVKYEDPEEYTKAPTKRQKKTPKEPEEKRLRRFRCHAPISYTERLERVRTQRMFLIDRKREPSEDGLYEIEYFDLAGSTGNIYKIIIDKVPSCNCPDARKGNQCKHIVYVLVNVLKTPSSLAYQLAFLSTELELIFANAPRTPQSSSDGTTAPENSNRKPIEGDCPVCVMEMEEGEDIVWCKAACGNNIHRQCQRQWTAQKSGRSTCVYCRAPWQNDAPANKVDLKRLKSETSGGRVTQEGYVNVAGELGISGRRDTSTYYNRYTYGRTGWSGDYGDY